MTEQTKVAVVYHSSTGTVHALAKAIVEGAKGAGALVRLRRVPDPDFEEVEAFHRGWTSFRAEHQGVAVAVLDDVRWADALIFGSPTRFGNISSQLKQFLDSFGLLWSQGLLEDKVYSGFTASATPHGGQESTLLAMYTAFYHFGGVAVAPGYTDPVKYIDGNPYGTSHTNDFGIVHVDDVAMKAARFQGKRVAKIAGALKAGLASTGLAPAGSSSD
jgi:NAD(P)H dehydrogenase (quinone)